MKQYDDLSVAKDLLERKPGAFEQFVDIFHSKLFQYSFLMCGHREDAEEVSQETLLQVFRRLDSLREPEKLKAWVFRIAKNACLMKRRRSVFAPSRELSLSDYMPQRSFTSGQHKIEIADWSKLPVDLMLRSELYEVLRHAISELPETYRSVLLLRDVEGLRTDETAEILEISGDLVKQRLHRARLAVRSKLDQYLKVKEANEHGEAVTI